jgi:precorrin-2/cobalt-factor-2 C20-methyltransferase
MKGKLYGVGVGPGEPELITLKALRIIEQTEVLAVPDTGREGSIALDIASKAADVSGKEILFLSMPMTKDLGKLAESHDDAANAVACKLDAGDDVAFLTLGDPTVYSTYMYVHKRVAAAGYETAIINGVPSFCAAAASLGIPLCEGPQALHLIPATYQFEDYLHLPGTKVLMKPGKALDGLRGKLRGEGKLEKAVMVERCGMEGERIYWDLDEIDDEKSYFSIIIVT